MIELYDKVKITNTGEVGYVVDISENNYLILEREEEDKAGDRLIFDIKADEVEVLE